MLDYIRGTTLANREAGKITQHIGATEVPLETIREVCGGLLEAFKLTFTIPGLLFIDTPGHAAFTNLRKRGGSIADLAVLIVDINQGVQPQTKEAIEILKTFKVPFILAANKVDVLPAWKDHDKTFIVNLSKQIPSAKEAYEKKFYELLGQISELGFSANIYTKVEDHTKEISIVPISAKTGEGVAELLALLTGLSQKFLSEKLEIREEDPARGTILEIKEVEGMGTIADVIIYDGSLSSEDRIIVGGREVFETKIRALLKPQPLSEIRDKKSAFKHIDRATAATGVRISATKLDEAFAGAPFASAHNDKEVEEAKQRIIDEIEDVLIETDEEGIILKADTLGSLEASTNLLREHGIEIKKADIGEINKKDIMAAASNPAEKAFVLGFNAKMSDGVKKVAKENKVRVISNEVIYKLIEQYDEELKNLNQQLELEQMEGLVWPAKFKILSQYIFRQSNPAVFGVEVLAGKLKPKVDLLTEKGEIVGTIKGIEDQGKKLEELKVGNQAALSVTGLTIGRQAKGGDVLYVDISENNFRTLKGRAKKFLSKAEIDILKDIAEIKRKEKEFWGM